MYSAMYNIVFIGAELNLFEFCSIFYDVISLKVTCLRFLLLLFIFTLIFMDMYLSKVYVRPL